MHIWMQTCCIYSKLATLRVILKMMVCPLRPLLVAQYVSMRFLFYWCCAYHFCIIVYLAAYGRGMLLIYLQHALT